MQHLSESLHITNNQNPRLALNYSNTRETIEFAGHSLPMRTHAACNIGVRGRRDEACTLALAGCEACQAQKFGLDAIVNGESAEFVYALG